MYVGAHISPFASVPTWLSRALGTDLIRAKLRAGVFKGSGRAGLLSDSREDSQTLWEPHAPSGLSCAAQSHG